MPENTAVSTSNGPISTPRSNFRWMPLHPTERKATCRESIEDRSRGYDRQESYADRARDRDSAMRRKPTRPPERRHWVDEMELFWPELAAPPLLVPPPDPVPEPC